MKSIMLSINPKWVAKIMNGEKEYEIRKTRPNCELPIDVYMYVTKGKPYLADFGDYEYPYKSGGYEATWDLYNIKRHEAEILNGKVVAKFTLDKVEEIVDCGSRYLINNDAPHTEEVAIKSCLDFADLKKYLKGKNGYAWHISNLVIFDKPKELSEFGLKRVPESWQYVEVE